MSKWINAECYFEPRTLILWVDHRQVGEFGILHGLQQVGGTDKLHEFCELLIERHRPEYRGCCIHYMGYAPEKSRWEFMISHPSLAEVPLGDCAPSERLVP